MHIGSPFTNIVGILSGNPQHTSVAEEHRLQNMFPEG